MLQLELAHPTSQGILNSATSDAMKTESQQAACQDSDSRLWLLSSGLPSLPASSTLASSQAGPKPGFQPWRDQAPLQPLVFQAQVPCVALAGVQLTLLNRSLWEKFYATGNEMIITRPGRRMFPVLRVKVTGMESSAYYMILVDLVPADNFRYRFLGNCWLPVETAESDPGVEPRLYLHENGPCLGSQWELRPVDFGAIKLTNQNYDAQHQMKLQSMRKYVPRVHVFAGSDVQQLDYRRFKTFVFPETSFISVTSYQNDQIISLKIRNNPYARSFCNNGERRSVLKRLLDEESLSDEDTNGNSSKFRPLINIDGFETPRSSSPSHITSAAAAQNRLANSFPALVTPPSIPPYPCPYSPPPCFSYPPYSACMDWCSPLYGLGRQSYGYASAGAAGSCRSYVPSPYLSAATAAPMLPPMYLPALSASQSTGAVSMTTGFSMASSMSAPSAAPIQPLTSATSSTSSAATMSSAFPTMLLSSAAHTPASQVPQNNATL